MLKIEENVMIKNLVTMRIGGPAKFVITVTDKEDIPEAYKFAKESTSLGAWRRCEYLF